MHNTPSASAPHAGARTRHAAIRHIAIDLRFDWVRKQAEGSATITVSPLRPTAAVAFDAAKLLIQSITLADGTPLAFQYDGSERDDALAIVLDRVYQPTEELTLKVRYRTGWINQSDPANLWGSVGKGLRFFEPTATDARKRRQIWSSQEPGANRYWFPGFDSPGELRSSEFTATVDRPLTVVAGGSLVSVKDNADGTRSFHWKTEAPQANHRTGFVIGEYEDLPQSAEGVALHNFGYPDERDGTAPSVQRLPDMLRFFTQLTGTRFPFPSYTQVFVQDLPWGMPGSGFAAQTENMVDDAGTHADFLYLWNGLQAESLAHQWFGNHLSAATWGEAWLDRGFAHYFAALYGQYKNGHDEFLLWYVRGDHQTYLADWTAGLRHATVDEQAADPSAFATGNYPSARGASVLHMLRKELGDPMWKKVLVHYVSGHGKRATARLVTTADLQDSVQAVTGSRMDWFFEQWLRRVGHPIFEVSYQHDAASARLVLTVKQVQPQGGWFRGGVDIAIDGRIERVQLLPQAENRFSFAQPQAPQLVHFDVEEGWIKELRFAKPVPELLHQLRHSTDTLGRQWAMDELVRLAKSTVTSPDAVRQIHAGLRELALSSAYWRLRFNALQQLRALLAPNAPAQPALLDAVTRQTLLTVIRQDGSWLRSAALHLLGLSRDPSFASLYLSHLRDPSDRVINAAATALGRSGSPLAFDALTALPSHPSWKNQSLISALDGLKALKDPRGAELALKALADVQSARWTLSTPVWDYRIAAAQTLAELGQGAQGFPLVFEHLQKAMAQPHGGDVNDIFSNALLLATLGDARARAAFPLLRLRFSGDAEALKVVDQLEAQLNGQ